MEVEVAHDALERMLEDGSGEPMNLPFSLLEDITDNFSEDRQLGSGGFAVVYKGMVGDGMVAVKKLTNTFNLEEAKFHKEVQCLVKAKHKNVVRFLGYCAETQGKIADYEGNFVMSDTRNWLLCFEYVPNGSLDTYIADASHGLEWVKRFGIIKGICEGLCYLHDKRILHLDLKPANILIADHGVPKLADFGLSRCINEEQTRIFTSNLCGSVGYLAPEFFRGQIAFTSDIYSLGVIIVEILTGEKGYPDDESVVESWMNRLEGDMQLEQVRVCTKIGIECMESDPKKRPAARHIIDRLEQTSGIEETGASSLLKEQQCQESIGNTFAAEIEDVAQRLHTFGNEPCQVKEDQLYVWGSPDIKEYQRDTSNSSSNSGVFRKLSNFDIFNRKAHRNFTRNGGPIIQQSNSVMIFLKEDMKGIFKTRNLVARGAFGDVYTGNVGNRPVTVRKPIAGSLLRNEEFANQVIKRSQVIHKNIIRLIGCCLDVDIPILVYEFVYNGCSLRNILESNEKVSLNLGVRLHIAAQAADGLAYTHSETHNRILICGLEAANILLDESFMPKISDFGISGAPPVEDITAGDYFVGRPVKQKDITAGDYFVGRPANQQKQISDDFVGLPASGNKNPIAIEENQWTQQSDVYSFGIIILELISGKDATHDEDNSLVKKLLKCHKKGKKATELFDKEIAIARDLKILDTLAEIAVECLSSDVHARPRMIEVAGRLLRISRTYSVR